MKSLFIIPSCINFSAEKPLDYSKVRSAYSSEDRFSQTLETIRSVRRFSPTSDIFLLEISDIDQNKKRELAKACDYTSFPTNDSIGIDSYFKDNANKSHAVAFLILKSLYCVKCLQYPVYDLFFQLSGRYQLNSNFNIEDHKNNLFTAKKHEGFNSETAIYTTLFSFSKKFCDHFYIEMLWTLSITTNYLPPHAGYSLETNMIQWCPDKATLLETMGVQGNLGPCGEFQKI